MEAPTSAEVRLEDPLTPTTRRARTALLAFSALGFIIGRTGLVPNKISGLDIEFAPEHRVFLVLIALGAVAYSWLSFVVYASSDFSRRRIALRNALLKERTIDNRQLAFSDFDAGSDPVLRQAAASARLTKTLQTANEQYLWPYWQMATPLGWLRDFLEFVFPIIFGAYTMYLLAKLASAIIR